MATGSEKWERVNIARKTAASSRATPKAKRSTKNTVKAENIF